MNSAAQTNFGLSLNMGNRQQFHPSSPGFVTALAPSGNLFINQQREIKDQWIAQHGLAAGVMGYNLKVVFLDTLGPGGDISPFPEYSTVFGSVDVLLGRKFFISKSTFMIGAGGGVTFYASFAPVSLYRIEVADPDDNRLITVFNARMTAPANTYSFFWKISLNCNISSRLTAVAEYVHHGKSAAEGSYHFFHTKTPQSGSIRVYQREFRLALGYKLRKGRKLLNVPLRTCFSRYAIGRSSRPHSNSSAAQQVFREEECIGSDRPSPRRSRKYSGFSSELLKVRSLQFLRRRSLCPC